MKLFPTPLRYPGGKAKLSPFLTTLFEENGLIDGHYVEPYVGGAGLACSLLLSGVARYLHLNDIDRSIYSVWHSILNETENLCKFINDVSVDLDEWKKQKEIQQYKDTYDLLTLSKSTLFLNRTNRSGVLTGGVIGGLDQSGDYKIDARFNKKSLIEQIKRISFYKKRIQLSNKDAKDFILDDVAKLPVKTLVNLDPPYYVKGSKLYQNSYIHDDHLKIARIVPEMKQYWMVTYDNVEPIRSMYKQFSPIEFNLKYSVNKRYIGKELMITDPRLTVSTDSLPQVV